MNKPVYIIGAGFSAELGYPTLTSLLYKLHEKLDVDMQKRFAKIIKFHYPYFEFSLPPERWPNINSAGTGW